MTIYISDWDMHDYCLEERKKLTCVKSVTGGAYYDQKVNVNDPINP